MAGSGEGGLTEDGGVEGRAGAMPIGPRFEACPAEDGGGGVIIHEPIPAVFAEDDGVGGAALKLRGMIEALDLPNLVMRAFTEALESLDGYLSQTLEERVARGRHVLADIEQVVGAIAQRVARVAGHAPRVVIEGKANEINRAQLAAMNLSGEPGTGTPQRPGVSIRAIEGTGVSGDNVQPAFFAGDGIFERSETGGAGSC
ncbi:MAG: hypothetical protein WC285_06075 [Candidatus Gracilibacteria bacterium]|jgi:hypothetical protein